jgi:hypothetical protein
MLVSAYAGLVQFVPFEVPAGQTQNDTNLMRAQEFLAQPSGDTILVGSSLTFRLPAQALGPHIVNLAFAGGAPATGLAVVRDSGAHPALVLVEINLLLRGVDQAMVESLMRFPERQLRRHLRVFRTGYDPVNWSWRGAMFLLHRAEVEPTLSPAVVRQLTQAQQREKSRTPDLGVLRQNLAQVALLVASLQARGTEVGFFEMPVDASLVDSPADAEVRREALRAFPSDKFCWLKLGVAGGAHTLDGIHLTADDAVLVAGEISQQRAACLRH